MTQTLEQKRAKYALGLVNHQKNKKDKKAGEDYGRHVKKFPAMVLNNGLGQTLAFLLADNGKAKEKGKEKIVKPSKELYNDIQKWLCGNVDSEYPCRVYSGGDLIESLMNGDRSDYVHAQEEVLSFFKWMRKFAEAYLGGDNERE